MNKEIDYNFKINNFTIRSNRVSKTIYKNENIPIFRVNVWYPISSENTFKNGREIFDTFFVELSNEFIDFIENRMANKVVKKSDLNHPYSAVMKFIPTFEDDNYLSLVVDSYLYTEKGKSKIIRMAFTFNKNTGNVVILDDIYNGLNNFIIKYYEILKDKEIQSKIKKAYLNSDFYFVPNGLILFYESNCEIITKFFSNE